MTVGELLRLLADFEDDMEVEAYDPATQTFTVADIEVFQRGGKSILRIFGND